MNIALIDNDPSFNELLKKEMEIFNFSYRYYSDFEKFKKGKESGYNTDILLLDIDMPDINGFDIAKELEKTNPDTCIIYITDHSELIFDSFGHNIHGFFPKSFLPNQKNLLINKIIMTYNENNFLKINNNGEIYRIKFNNIIYIETANREIIIHTFDKQKLNTKILTLNEIYSHLPPDLFTFINRSTIINISQVQFIKGYNCYMMNCKDKLYISRNRLKKVSEAVSRL